MQRQDEVLRMMKLKYHIAPEVCRKRSVKTLLTAELDMI